MRLIKPSYEIVTPINGEEILKQIELAARTCYKNEDKIKQSVETIVTTDKFGYSQCENTVVFAESARILIYKLITKGHEAMLEFGGTINVKFICDRGVSHELVRHRLASFAQESTRYCNYSNDEHITFIIPCWLNIEEGILYSIDHPVTDLNDGDIDKTYEIVNNYLQTFYTKEEILTSNKCRATSDWVIQMLLSEASYNSHIMVDSWSPQQARSVLPNSLKTEINVCANIREWRHIFKLRTASAAHPQMRELMCPLLDEFKSKIPTLFDDINYNN